MGRRTKFVLMGVAGALLLLALVIAFRGGDPLFRVLIAVGKYRALTLDAESVAVEMRKFARAVRWEKPPSAYPSVYIRHDQADFPKELQRTKASSISVLDDRVRLEFGGTFLHCGIVVFREGDGHGLKKLAEGVWFYSEDGKTSIF